MWEQEDYTSWLDGLFAPIRGSSKHTEEGVSFVGVSILLLFGSQKEPIHVLFVAFCLDDRTLSFCQLMGFRIKPLKVSLGLPFQTCAHLPIELKPRESPARAGQRNEAESNQRLRRAEAGSLTLCWPWFDSPTCFD